MSESYSLISSVKNISILGLGLMGGSFARALKERIPGISITAMDIDSRNTEEAKKDGAIDRIASSTEDLLSADLLILSSPLPVLTETLKKLDHLLTKRLLVTDLGSVKLPLKEVYASSENPNLSYIGLHPMTGSEKGGYRAADPWLYENAYCFLCRPEDERVTDRDFLLLEELVHLLGAYPVEIPAEEHDAIVANISHLPHILAASLVDYSDREHAVKRLPYIGGGFRDTTRIAASSSALWRGILEANHKEVLHTLKGYISALREWEELLQKKDFDGIEEKLHRAAGLRMSLPTGRHVEEGELFTLYVSVPDQPGILAALTDSLKDVNIGEIEILHSRERGGGAVRISFRDPLVMEEAKKLLTKEGYRFEEFAH